jgi:hypothetical protein
MLLSIHKNLIIDSRSTMAPRTGRLLGLGLWGRSAIRANFTLTEFSEVGSIRVCAAFLLQHLLASASDLHSDEPKGG